MIQRSLYDTAVFMAIINQIKTKTINALRPISDFDPDNHNKPAKLQHLYYDDTTHIKQGYLETKSFIDYPLIYMKEDDDRYVYYNDIRSPIGQFIDIFVRVVKDETPYVVMKYKPSINTFSHFDTTTIIIKNDEMIFSGDECNV